MFHLGSSISNKPVSPVDLILPDVLFAFTPTNSPFKYLESSSKTDKKLPFLSFTTILFELADFNSPDNTLGSSVNAGTIFPYTSL